MHENHACGGLNALVSFVMKYRLPYKYMPCIGWLSYTFGLAYVVSGFLMLYIHVHVHVPVGSEVHV